MIDNRFTFYETSYFAIVESMNIEDINSLQERINRIALASASPYIVISSNPEVSLRKYVGTFQANRYTTLSIYNEYKGRSITYPIRNANNEIVMNGGILHIGHVIASISTSREDVSTLISDLRDMIPLEMDVQIYTLFNILMSSERLDIVIEGTASILIHEYINDVLPSMDMVSLQEIYTRMKGMINMTGKILSIQSIIGGILYAYPNIPSGTMYNVLSRLEHESSPYHMTIPKINDAIDWYREQLEMRISQQSASFYERSLLGLLSIPTVPLQVYSPETELERVVIRPLYPLDIIDTISSARTSADMPIIIASVEGKKIIKVYDRIDTMKNIDLNWFMEAKRMTDVYGTMSMVIRISRYPDKYQLIQYNNNRNYFSMNKTRKYLSISEIVTLLSSHLNVVNLRSPYIANTTYSFITNYIVAGDGSYGINRHVLAWLITNPPAKYRHLNLHKYVFIKEDIKPNALRDHISIHIQLGVEKLYLTLSLHNTTKGTIVPVPIDIPHTSATDIELIGFDAEQRYIQVRINKAASIHHARIAQTIYENIISMYIEYYSSVRSTIYTMTGVSLPVLDPQVLPLEERVPNLRERFSYFDSMLYKYASDANISPLLPVPIDRDEAPYWRERNHDVIRLPTIVVNNPLIKFEVAGEIWIRTPSPGRFVLIEKKDGVYIPILHTPKINNGILVVVNSDMTLTDTQTRSSTGSYVLRDVGSLSNKIGRLAHVSKASIGILSPIFPKEVSLSTIRRMGISMNIVHALNTILNRSVSPVQIAQYAHLCMQENWQQSIDDIADDISSYRIEPLRHFRAIEYAYKINIYFLLDDQLEPYLRKPPHAYFYLHRESRKDWPTMIFHSLSSEPDVLTVLLSDTNTGVKGYKYLFGGHEYLDNLMERSNTIRMVSPTEGVDEVLHTVPILDSIGDWKAHEQVVDTYGKCRGITYRKDMSHNTYAYATINIGFAPIQDLPMGDIRLPSIQLSYDLPQMKDLILEQSMDSELSIWIQKERNARILRIITHILYSQMDISLDEFFDMIEIDDVEYDTSRIPHTIPAIGSYEDAWAYFASVTDGMIDADSYTIYVPDEDTKKALYLHMMATPKIRWPNRFPSFILYEWDIRSGRDELVFLRDADLVQYLMMVRSPTEVTQIVESVQPYILSRGDSKYLIQMASDTTHAKYIAYSWDENEDGPMNPGYETIVFNVQYPWREIPYDFTFNIDSIHFTRKDGRIYVIIPI